MINVEILKKHHHSLLEHLETGIIPFWLDRCIDHEFGGFLTDFDQDGRHLGTEEKYLNTQSRLIWWFSRLVLRYPERAELSKIAGSGVDFLISRLWDNEYGGWYWKVKRDGSRLVDAKLAYGQSFAIYALSQYYIATGDARALDYASRTFDMLSKYCSDNLHGGYYENLENDWQLAPDGFCGGDRKSLDIHMHLMESFTLLYQASGEELHRRKLIEVTDLIVKHMIDSVTGCGRNQFDRAFNAIPAISIRHTWNAEREGETPEVPVDSTSYGHNVELAWLMHRAVKTANIDLSSYIDIIKRLVAHALDHGVDWEFGGVYRDGIANAGAVVLEKEFWQNAEAIFGFLNAYKLFDDQRCFEAFEKVWAFVNEYMINSNFGEWRTLLSRDGTAIDPNIGNPWKVGRRYTHVPGPC